jgi:DNA-3-methyladenine glycosylase II
MSRASAKDPHADATRALTASCPRMGALIGEVGVCALGREVLGPFHTQGQFAGLVEAIVSQQLSSKAAATIFARVKALAPGGALTDPRALLAVPEAALRGAGLSGSKASYVRDLAERLADGRLDLATLAALGDEEVVEALCSVKGIGRWTAEMFLMFRLGRRDVLPVGDLGIQKGMMRLFALKKLPPPERMRRLARPWEPYRSVACWYLWRLTERPAETRLAARK